MAGGSQIQWAAAFMASLATATAAASTIQTVSSPTPEQVAELWPAEPLFPGFSLGNHRVEVAVPPEAQSQPAVLVHVVWRRRSQPNETAVVAALPVATQYANASILRNVAVWSSSAHEATVAFDPAGAAAVHLYWLPYHFSGGSGGYASQFTGVVPPAIAADPEWLAKFGGQQTPHPTGLAWANVTTMSARTEFDKYTCMEQAASPTEVATLLPAATTSQPFELFTETRNNSIRMDDALPIRWLLRANPRVLLETVEPGEFLPFQVGVYARAGNDITAERFSVSPAGLAGAVTCFNLGGTHFNGTNFTQSMTINSTKVGALWFGIDSAVAGAADGGSGWINFTLHLSLSSMSGGSTGQDWRHKQPHTADIEVALVVVRKATPIKAKGDYDPWRLSRLRWLNSMEGSDYSVSRGFIPITVTAGQEAAATAAAAATNTAATSGSSADDQSEGETPAARPASASTAAGSNASSSDAFTVALLNRRITVGRSTGLPTSILSNGLELLAAPMRFLATTQTGHEIPCTPAPGGGGQAAPTHLGEGAVVWSSRCILALAGGPLDVAVRSTTSYEGYIDFAATISHGKSSQQQHEAAELLDLRMEVAFRKTMVPFMMGLGSISGYRPQSITWPWKALGACSAYQNATVAKYGHQNPGDAVPQAWLGRVDAGLRIALKGADASWESPEDYPKGTMALGMTDWAGCPPPASAGSAVDRQQQAVNRSLCTGQVVVKETTGTPTDSDNGAVQDSVVLYTASLGAFSLEPAAKKELRWDLVITPLKPVNLSQHFSTRYWHFGGQFPPPESGLDMAGAIEQLQALNVTWVVIHQGSNLNPYINYPLRSDLMGIPSLQEFVDACHAKGIYVKLYFTTRELSNRCTEIFALKSLPNHEVLYGSVGDNGEGGGGETGGGGAWLQEHLGGDYKVAWSTVGAPGTWLAGIKGVIADEAVADDGASRWDNFFVKANQFLLESPGTDGVYLDAVAFERTTMERIRKNMERTKDNVRVDIHRSGGWYCHGPGFGTPALRYMQHFAWADSLWFGEGFDYWGQSPEWWLLETSGLPFGLTGDMIREGAVGPGGGKGSCCPDPNRWLGMVFGMATRLAWGGLGTNLSAVEATPEVQEVIPVWRYWSDFGIKDAEMVGWWDEACPVTTSDPNVKATVYIKQQEQLMLIAIGNFGKNDSSVTLTFKNSSGQLHGGGGWSAISREIEAYQPARTFSAASPIPVASKRGWLLEVALKLDDDETSAESPLPAIVTLAADASVSEAHAAAELASILTKISQNHTHFSVLTATKKLATTPQIAVGSGAALMLSIPADTLGGLGMEGFLAHALAGPQAGSVVLTGAPNSPRGSLYAMNYFVESLGVQFLAQDTTILPAALPATLPPMHETFSPQLEYRQQFEYGLNQPTKASVDLNVHLGLNKDSLGSGGSNLDAAHGGAVIYAPNPGFVHTSFALVPPGKFKASHPDWFATNQLCWKAPGLKEYLASRVATLLREQPNASIISVSQNDGYGYCQRGPDQVETQKEGSPMAPMLQTVNYVADSIAAEFPHVAIDTLAYVYTRQAPNITRPRNNVIIRLCSIECNFGAPLTDRSNADFQRDMKRWAVISNRTYIWNYQTNFHSYITPFPNYYVVGQNIKFFADHGVKGIFQEGSYNGPGGDLAELRDYVSAKMMWDPTLDAQQLISSFISGYYGPVAAPHIKAYMDIMHDSVANVSYYMGEGFDGINADFLTADVLLRSAAALTAAKIAHADANAADRSATSPPSQQLLYSQHVNRSSIAVWYVALHRFQELFDYAAQHHIIWPLESTLEECFESFASAVALTNQAYSGGPDCVPTSRNPCGKVVLREGGPPLNVSALHDELFQPCQPGFARAKTGSCELSCPDAAAGGKHHARPVLPHNVSASNVDGRLIATSGDWDAGAKAPQWIQLSGFETGAEAGGIILGTIEAVVNMEPSGFANHSIFVDDSFVGSWAGKLEKGQVLTFRPSSTLTLKHSLKILTSVSPSWVAWNSITVFSCSPSVHV